MTWERAAFWLLCGTFVGMHGWLASAHAPAPVVVMFTVLAGWPLMRCAYLSGLQDRGGAR